ncbi:hypothetical protein HYZ76_01315 [Candidatus Falkowbacteria bacterium]|nr:hypothetical protein [Candidatus Falkowbacteria bacterium]
MKKLIKLISIKEWRFIIALSAATVILTGLPYVFGFLTSPPDAVYNGLHALSPGDIPVYYSYINQVRSGDFFVKNLFTSEPQAIGTFNAWWFLVGIFAEFFNLPTILAFQLFRLLLIPVFVVTAYLFIVFFFKEEIKRKVCLIFLLFSGGIGFYFSGIVDRLDILDQVSYSWPIDLWLTESNTFNILYQTSHFIASITLTIWIFLLMILAFRLDKVSYAVISGFLGLFYFNFHPYYFPAVFGVLGLYLFVLMIQKSKFLWRGASYLLLAFTISLPSALYHFYLIAKSPVIGQRALQNVTEISPPIFVLLGYGFLVAGFFLGLYFLFRNKKFNTGHVFLVIWLLVNLGLVYSDFPFHSRYTQGINVVLVIFTVIGLFSLRDLLEIRLKPKVFDFWVNNPALLFLLFIFVFGTASLYSLSRDYYYFYFKPGQTYDSLYLSQDFMAAMSWLSDKPKSEVVLGAPLPSYFIPAFSGHPVYAAHGHETLFFYSKIVYVDNFFQTKSDQVRRNFLGRESIKYLLYTKHEKKLGDFDPAGQDYLELVFDRPQAKLYRVTLD